MLPPDFVTFPPGLVLSLGRMFSLSLRVEVVEGAVVLVVVEVKVEEEGVEEGLERGLKVALRSSSQGGRRCLVLAPTSPRPTHLKWTSRYFSTPGQTGEDDWKTDGPALTVQELLPAHSRSNTVLLDLCRQSVNDLEELEEEEEVVQMLEESLP